MVDALAASFLSAETDKSPKCPKLAKFLLQVLGKISKINKKAIEGFKQVASINKTFLKKRLEVEIAKLELL